jgi:hypothetical protein
MRIWSVHPSYLDSKGLVALWREALLARKVLLGQTKGYKHHPQLDRFRKSADPLFSIDAYLTVIADEALQRGYRFDITKFNINRATGVIQVTDGQLKYETEWLKKKLKIRDPDKLINNRDEPFYRPHPLFLVTEGAVESWEKGYVV